MAISPEKAAANRANSLKSTGPRTDEGKAVSRQNSLKHGLTGAGVVVPGEDAGAVAERFREFEAELNPKGGVGRWHARRAAMLTVRLDRSVRHETAMLTEKMLKARASHDEERLAEVDRLFSKLAADPHTSARRLITYPEGIDRMIETFEDLKFDVSHPTHTLWSRAHYERAENMTGRPAESLPISRLNALSDCLMGMPQLLEPGEVEGLSYKERDEWAKAGIIALIDDDIRRLAALREKLDHDAIALDREGAVDRALFDPSHQMTLARRYENNTARELKLALEQVRRLNEEPQPDDATRTPEATSDAVASFLPDEPDDQPPPPEVEPCPHAKPPRISNHTNPTAETPTNPTTGPPWEPMASGRH